MYPCGGVFTWLSAMAGRPSPSRTSATMLPSAPPPGPACPPQLPPGPSHYLGSHTPIWPLCATASAMATPCSPCASISRHASTMSVAAPTRSPSKPLPPRTPWPPWAPSATTPMLYHCAHRSSPPYFFLKKKFTEFLWQTLITEFLVTWTFGESSVINFHQTWLDVKVFVNEIFSDKFGDKHPCVTKFQLFVIENFQW